MGLYSIRQNPGLWVSWFKKPENNRLPIMEAKKKYLKEQLDFQNQQNFFTAQRAQRGVFIKNEIVSTEFGSVELRSITSNVSIIDVGFKLPVIVTGSPTITVNNSQAGGGSASTFTYTYATGSTSDVLRFVHNHPTTSNNKGGFAANVISDGIDLLTLGATTSSFSNISNGTYNNVEFTSGSSVGNGDLILGITVAGGLVDEVDVTAAGTGYKPGDVLTFVSSSLGGSATSAVTGSLTLVANNFTGDVITIPAQTIALAGGTIKTFGTNPKINDTIRRQGNVPGTAIPVANQASKTVIAS